MDWRTWVFQRISTCAPVLADVPLGSIHGSSSLTGAPKNKPFIVISFGGEAPDLYDADAPVATSQRASIYVHDTPGDYLRIGRILRNVRNELAGTTAGMNGGGGIIGLWEGDSTDLADELFKTIMRYGEYRFVGKVA